MPVYSDTEQLLGNLRSLFDRIKTEQPGATQKVAASRLVIRLACNAPKAEIWINGRGNPVQITYAPSSLRPDLDIELSADALHQILLGELTLAKAIGSSQLRVRGPVWKSFVLEDVFHYGQSIYPQILRDNGSTQMTS